MARRAIERVFGVRSDEVGPATLCAFCYFLVLAAWFIVRPLRDEAGLAGGVDNLNWLFLGTLAVTLAATPGYGALAHTLPRRWFVPVVYSIAMASLAAFGAAFLHADGGTKVWVGRAFYIWASVLNLFVVAVFTSLMVDVWSLRESKRVFGLIAVGGTLGAMTGSAVTAALSSRVAAPGLLALSCVVLAVAAALMTRVARRARAPSIDDRDGPRRRRGIVAAGEGVWLVLRSPYLIGVCVFLLCLTATSSFLYFEKMRILEASIESPEGRRAILAQINLGTQSLTLGAQVFLTAHAMRRLGVAATLVVMPLMTLAGFAALALAPLLATVVLFEVVRGASNYAFTKPARETLFTVLGRAEKYKAKGFIDTFVYRGGDAIGALTDKAIMHSLPLGSVPLVAMVIAGAWCAVAAALGTAQRRLAGRGDGDCPDDGGRAPGGASVAAALPADPGR